jgi:hypothetical protein
MTEVISVRMEPEKLSKLDRRAADSGLDRSKYLMRLVEADLAQPLGKSKRRFASGHLLGKFRSTGSSNAKIRAALKARVEKDR